MARSPKNTQAGITLIETIVWISIFSYAMIALSSAVAYFYRTTHYVIEQSNAIASAQRGIDTMTRAIREASYASNGSYPIISLDPNQIAFYANINHGDFYVQRVRFFVQGTNLFEGVIEPSGDPPTYSTTTETISTVAQDVQNLTLGSSTFAYYDQNGALMSDLTRIAAVRFVKATVVVDTNPNDRPTQLTLYSSTALRNLVGH